MMFSWVTLWNRTTPFIVLLLAAIVALAASSAEAKNVDLSTVPARQRVQLTIYNSEDLTLVREIRKVSFKPGVNPLQFSWANTLIDPTSVELRFLTHPDKLDLLDTTFPHDKPQMLYWNVAERIRRRGHRRDLLLHQRHQLVGRLRVHRQSGRDGNGPGGFRARVQQLGRRVRGRPGAAGRGPDQSGREDCPVGAGQLEEVSNWIGAREQEHCGIVPSKVAMDAKADAEFDAS